MNLITTELKSGIAIISFQCESLDAGNIKKFREEITPVLESADHVLIDMSKLSFVDSSGLGALLTCYRSLTTRDSDLRLFGLSKPVLALFELVRMHRLFSIYENRDEAIADIELCDADKS